jgi:hypothetical protein
MNKADKKKLFGAYAIKKDFHDMPGGERLAITELSAQSQIGYLDVVDNQEIAVNYIILHGFDDFTDDDADSIAAMGFMVKQDMMNSVLKLSGLIDDAEEAEQEKKP